ncbi:histidinol-phosphate transaminase [Portibacter marinus]|uniref:histidinol-phosphate transaminase n=1 Tax=Portibacter marinus TaxID=2898660 RepID=UPI001F2DEFE4|nr:histidinol-phosphate transaminase [Portibacter marinus]
MRAIEQLIRPELLSLKPYSSARDEFQGRADVFIDANENPFENGVNRYPDPLQRALKKRISEIKNLPEDQIFLGNGSDEVLDLIFRLFCVPGKDAVIITPPTYGMYKVLAGINNIFVKSVNLTSDFQLQHDAILKTYDRETKLLFLCSPNNPVGISLHQDTVEHIIDQFPGIVVIDEAYIDFSNQPGFMELISGKPNLIVVQTLSKAWGMAGIRLGMAFTNSYIVSALNKIKPPYNVNVLTQRRSLQGLENIGEFTKNIEIIKSEKDRVGKILATLPMVERVFDSDANFLLVKFDDCMRYFNGLKNEGIIVRDRSQQQGCAGCLRITIGTPEENDKLIKWLVK